MKFITEDGKILEGVALTDRQSTTRDRFEEWLHEHVCTNAYHGSYGSRPCRDAANMLIPKLDDSAVGALSSAIFEPEPAPVPVPEPSTVEAAAEKEMPF
jgi:hypothetical protein